MANWKLGKIQYGFASTATSGGTLVLTASSRQFQILTGTMSHNVQLPDATTAATGISFIICNQSSETIDVNYNDTTLLVQVKSGQTSEFFLTDISTSNGTWTTVATGGSAGIGAIDPGAVITTDYSVVSNDNGRLLNIDTSSGPIEITLPPADNGFKITIKDYAGFADINQILIKRDAGSELIDSVASDDQINEAYKAVSLISDGTDWYRIASFVGDPLLQNGRGIFGGGYTGTATNVIDYVEIGTLSNATDFGDLTLAGYYIAACSSSTRGLFGGGRPGLPSNVIDYVTIASVGNATDFGDLTLSRYSAGGCSNSTRGVFGGGYTSTGVNNIDYVTIATTGNAIDFGDLSVARGYLGGACASSTRGVFGGGYNGITSLNVIDYITIATLGNAIDFGDLTSIRSTPAVCSNSVRGFFAGGNNTGGVGGTGSNIIDYITIASTGNATDFGDLTVARNGPSGCASPFRALFGGGYTGTATNVIDYVTIATLGNATDFGDLTVARWYASACSNSHGGL